MGAKYVVFHDGDQYVGIFIHLYYKNTELLFLESYAQENVKVGTAKEHLMSDFCAINSYDILQITHSCVVQDCPKWTEWTSWTVCANKCDEDTYRIRNRMRTCESGRDCPGSSREIRFCQLTSCPYWDQWMDWSGCSVTCGIGVCERRRRCVTDDLLNLPNLDEFDEAFFEMDSEKAKSALIARSRSDVLNPANRTYTIEDVARRAPVRTTMDSSGTCTGSDVERKSCDAGREYTLISSLLMISNFCLLVHVAHGIRGVSGHHVLDVAHKQYPDEVEYVKSLYQIPFFRSLHRRWWTPETRKWWLEVALCEIQVTFTLKTLKEQWASSAVMALPLKYGRAMLNVNKGNHVNGQSGVNGVAAYGVGEVEKQDVGSANLKVPTSLRNIQFTSAAVLVKITKKENRQPSDDLEGQSETYVSINFRHDEFQVPFLSFVTLKAADGQSGLNGASVTIVIFVGEIELALKVMVRTTRSFCYVRKSYAIQELMVRHDYNSYERSRTEGKSWKITWVC
uniref:TSP1_spondin domain-containing protein n=1 Tax=Angiostrongylus cantonensis TaxID=6313 RepID=A0A158PCP3_ANGCA